MSLHDYLLGGTLRRIDKAEESSRSGTRREARKRVAISTKPKAPAQLATTSQGVTLAGKPRPIRVDPIVAPVGSYWDAYARATSGYAERVAFERKIQADAVAHWVACGRPPHPVFSPKEWHARNYYHNLRLPTAAPYLCNDCGQEQCLCGETGRPKIDTGYRVGAKALPTAPVELYPRDPRG
jgi:hypothetical protein